NHENNQNPDHSEGLANLIPNAIFRSARCDIPYFLIFQGVMLQMYLKIPNYRFRMYGLHRVPLHGPESAPSLKMLGSANKQVHLRKNYQTEDHHAPMRR